MLIHPISALLPYTPSYVFVSPPNNDSLVYLLLSKGSTHDKIEFLSLNISRNVDAANPEYSALDETPFNSHKEPAAFVPVIDEDGMVKVYTGDCQSPPSQGVVWQFTPDDSSSVGNGTWHKHSVTTVDNNDEKQATFQAPNYLAAGFTYASTNTTPSSVYTFGGMCPFRTGSDGDDWVSSANYSQSMIALDPTGPSSGSSYEIKTTADRAPPIPEAGFTITPLQATYRTTSTGDVRQEQSFLLIGGHTQKAFVNMSQLALFSLPQNSWSFVDVGSMSDSGTSKRVVQGSAAIGPRSGHSAILSPDGSRVTVFGGWVGNTSVAAKPLLAVLELGEGYGGSGQWVWNVPSMESPQLTDGTGLFGHGATMLPGDVMMIAGGYTIPPKTSSPSKRFVSQPELNSNIYFYNITSNSWATSYTNPSQKIAGTSKSGSGPLSSVSKKAGLGVGIALGVSAVAGLAFLAWFYIRRRRTRRRRDQAIRDLALGAERSHFWNEPNMSSSFQMRIGRDSTYPWAGNQGDGGNFSWRDQGETAAERTGLLGPTKPNQRALNTGSHHRQYSDFRRRDSVSGNIHTIDEREEEAANATEVSTTKAQNTDQRDSGLGVIADLLAEPQNLGPHDPLLEDVDRASGASTRSSDQDISSGKSNCTITGLSDTSTSSFSVNSAVSIHDARVAIFTRYPGISRGGQEQYTPPSTNGSDHSSTMVPAEKHVSADSFSTAHTKFSQRQAESEYLLTGGHERTSPPESPSKAKAGATKPKAYELIGNVRRALTGTRKGTPAKRHPSAAASMTPNVDRSLTATGSSSSYGSTLPRRAVSASAELYRRKQGAKDWGASNNNNNRDSREILLSHTRIPKSIPRQTRLEVSDDDEDWDVEAAAEGRRVQVTYTVPKEKLRVVNATAGDMDDFSEKSPSRRTSGGCGERSVSR